MRTVGLAVEQTDACREDLVEAAVSEVDVLDRPDEELGLSRGDVLLVPSGRGVDHLRRAVDRRESAGSETLADEGRGDAVPAPDLEHVVPWADVQPVDDLRRSATAEV